MKIISTKISYDDLISKLPGIIPSIVNYWSLPQLYNCGNYMEGEKYYNHSSAVKRAYEFNVNESELEYGTYFVEFDKKNLIDLPTANYGLIPSDVIIPKEIAEKITAETDFYVNIPDKNGGFYDLSWPKKKSDPHYEGRKIISGGTEIKILTYYTLNKWYAFFKEYYDKIKRKDFPVTYDSAVEFYEKEYKVKNADLRKKYEELDAICESRGGKEMYDWISNNCIVQYIIPENLVDEWHTTYLYFPDALKWYEWFKERYEKYDKVLYLEDCKDTETCDDCLEYLRLGGADFFAGEDRKGGLKAFIENITLNQSYATKSASITIPITITSSIDDLGEMAILSSEWNEETNYHNTLSEKGYSTNGLKGGTMVHSAYELDENGDKVLLPDTYMITNGSNKGYTYNEFYENVWTESNWTPYTEYYRDDLHKEEFYSTAYKDGNTKVEITGYTISPINGKMIYNPIDDDVKEEIEINIIKSTCIDGITYNVIKGKYVELCYDTERFANLKYKKHKKLQIFKDGDLEYAVLNGKRKYIELNSEGEERIYFLRESNCYDEGCVVKNGEYIIFDECLYLVEDKKVTIQEDEAKRIYSIVDGYFNINDNRFYISGNTVVLPKEYSYNEDSNSYIFDFRELTKMEMTVMNFKKLVIKDDILTIYYTYEVTDCTKISGRTDSKADLLRRKEITTDDLGNELPGYFRSIVSIDGGKDQSRYNVPYDECTLDILYKVGEVSDLYPNENLSTNGSKFYDGNILTNIVFYYKDIYGKTVISVNADNDNALDAIKRCEQLYETKSKTDDTIVNVLLCDITYYLGAVIQKINDKYRLASNYHKGVKYVDTVYVSKSVGTYYLNEDRSFTFNYYLLTQDVQKLQISDFNAAVNWDISTYFEMVPRLYYKKGVSNDNYAGWYDNNNIIVAPLFRNEYNLASSYPQNVDANIYIDRGISAAFEKHLKLQEVRTMESLMNLQNGGFKINEY